jgi:hypothetical protein
MILDAQNMFSDQQAIVATGAIRSTNVIDLQQIGIPYGNVERLKRDVGKGDDVPLVVQVTQTFNTLTSLTVSIQTSDDPAFGSGNIDHYSTYAIPLAQLTAGFKISHSDLMEAIMGNTVQGLKRYISILYTVVGTAPTLGKITAGLVGGVQTNA